MAMTTQDTASEPKDTAKKTSRRRSKDAGRDGADEALIGRGEKESSARKALRFSTATILVLALLIFELTLLVLIVMLVLGLIPLEVAGDPGPLFQLLPLVLMFGWLGLLTGYLAWCTHFYNYNFGRSEAFWRKFTARCREAEAEGRTENEVYDELAAPRQNPYAAETFGIPPGTVRGTMAITILVAALGLLISLFGGAPPSPTVFDFFETAFLMVVAFYFGTKGLSILQGEIKTIPDAAPASLKALAKSRETASQATADDGAPAASFDVSPAETDGEASEAEPSVTAAGLLGGRQRLLDLNFPHIRDLITDVPAAAAPEKTRVSKELEPADYEEFARKYELEIPVVRAVVEVESGGRGFLKDGRPKILFEGHVFWKQLKERGIDPNTYASDNPTIVYPTWQRKFYKGGSGEYERLAAAKLIDEGAALSSASWGLFQIMGYHAPSLKYDDVFDFVDEMYKSEREHLEAFGRFLERDGLLDFLRQKQWASFARRYNGPRYAENKYDEKLEKAFATHKMRREGVVPA